MQMNVLARSALALSAMVGAVATAPAYAVVVTSGPVSIAVPDDIDGIYVNLVTGASGVTAVAGYDINPYSAVAGQFNLWSATTTTWLSPSGVINGTYPLTAGTSIGPGGAFFRPGGSLNVGTQVALNATNLFGVQFTNESLATTNYGWVAITFGATAGERTITGWAYETSGGSILAGVGVVPEPGAYAMMLAGLVAVGAAAARRRKASAQA